jgi:hypothetical protein
MERLYYLPITRLLLTSAFHQLSFPVTLRLFQFGVQTSSSHARAYFFSLRIRTLRYHIVSDKKQKSKKDTLFFFRTVFSRYKLAFSVGNTGMRRLADDYHKSTLAVTNGRHHTTKTVKHKNRKIDTVDYPY